MKDKSVLAFYDVRGKQEYIYRSKKIREIVGASCIIRDAFSDYLYPAAQQLQSQMKDLGKQAGIYQYKREEVKEFSLKAFQQRMAKGDYIGEVLYEGGAIPLFCTKIKIRAFK